MSAFSPMAFLAAVLSFVSAASADDALRIAERGGFLLGQAYRCGSPVEHLENPANLIQSMLRAAAASSDQRATAEQTFAEQFLVNMITPGHAGLLPSCARVRRELSRLAEHPAPTTLPGGSADVNATPVSGRLAKSSGSAQTARPQERSAGRSRHD